MREFPARSVRVRRQPQAGSDRVVAFLAAAGVVVSVRWDFTEHDGVGVLHLFGFLGRQDTHRFEGAVGWVRSRSNGTLVLDMSGLLGWNEEGEAAVVRAARSPLAVCGLLDRSAPLLSGDTSGLIRIYSDLRSALADLATA